MAKTLMGMDNQYTVGPDGTLQNNPVQEKPGSFFRKLLGAALLGGAAGAAGNPAQGFAGGLVRGSAAGMQQAQQQDQMKKQQAQGDFANQQKVQQQSREQTLMNAQVQQMHSEQIARQHTSDLADQAAHDKHNAASAALVSNLTKAGGTPAVIPVNGKAASDFTANDLAQAYIKDPSILKAPTGYMRAFVDTTDSSGLTYNGTNWVDDAGKPVNMTDNTTVKAIDVPIDAMKTKIPTTGQEINDAYGGKLVDPDKTYPMAPTDMIVLNSKRMAESKQQAAIDLDKHRAATADMANRLKERELKDKEQGSNSSVPPSVADPKNVSADGINHAYLAQISQTDPHHAAMIQAIGEGRETPSTYGLSRKEGQTLMAEVNAAYPSYDMNNTRQYETTRKEFGPAGKQGKTLQAGGTALEHLGHLYDSVGMLQTVPGLKTIGDWLQSDKSGQFATNAGNAAQEIGTFYANGGAAHEQDVAGYGRAYTGAPDKVREAVKQQAVNMMDKIKEIAASYNNSVPSTFVKPQTFLSPQAAAAYTRITGEKVDPSLVRHATVIGQNSPDNGQPFAPPAGSFAGRDTHGNIVQYKLPNGTIVDAKTGQPVTP
jgi:hypothetical protein